MTEYVPQNLVNGFVASVTNHFLPLQKTYSLSRSLEAEILGSQEVVPPEDIGDRFFLLQLKLESGALAISISYGDREHDLSCDIRSGGQENSYALWEWLEVLGRSSLLVDHGGWVLTAERIETVIAQYERILEQIVPTILSAKSIKHDLERRRQEHFRQLQQQEVKEEHSHHAVRASEAFHRGDFKTAITYLTSIREELSPSEQAMLTYARKRTDNKNDKKSSQPRRREGR